MKKVFYVLLTLVLITGINSCEKTEDKSAELCSNGVWDPIDNDEHELDCGGPHCDACPDSATFTARLGDTDYKAIDVGGMTLGPGIRVFAHDSTDRFVDFTFFGKTVGQPSPVAYGRFYYQGENHTFGTGDTGTVVLTALDTVRHIASGTFSYQCTRDRSIRKASLTAGVFTNVRY